MSMGCSSSCCTAPFQRYTERQGARIFTHAATRFSTSSSARRSAAARSGRLVSTSKALISESFVYGGIAQPHAEHALQSAIVQAPRLAHEGKEKRIEPLFGFLQGDPRRLGEPAALR